MQRAYCVYFEGDDRYHALSDEARLIGLCTDFDLCEQSIKIHASAFQTNDLEPFEFYSRGMADVKHGRYFLQPINIDEMPDYSMRVN